MVQFGVSHQILRRRRALQGRDQGFGALLENLCIRGLAVPTFAHKRHATVLGHYEFQHRLFQIRPVVFGIAMRIVMACSSLSGTYAPVRAKLVVSR